MTSPADQLVRELRQLRATVLVLALVVCGLLAHAIVEARKTSDPLRSIKLVEGNATLELDPNGIEIRNGEDRLRLGYATVDLTTHDGRSTNISPGSAMLTWKDNMLSLASWMTSMHTPRGSMMLSPDELLLGTKDESHLSLSNGEGGAALYMSTPKGGAASFGVYKDRAELHMSLRDGSTAIMTDVKAASAQTAISAADHTVITAADAEGAKLFGRGKQLFSVGD